jgi:hypothetical protein
VSLPLRKRRQKGNERIEQSILVARACLRIGMGRTVEMLPDRPIEQLDKSARAPFVCFCRRMSTPRLKMQFASLNELTCDRGRSCLTTLKARDALVFSGKSMLSG